MNWKNALAYRMAAAEGATHLEMLILVYDAIATDLLKAANAAREVDVQARCDASSHALLLLGHLETWVALEQGEALQQSLRHLYAVLRAGILQSQAGNEPAAFEDLAGLVNETRVSWQAKQKALRSSAVAASPVPLGQTETLPRRNAIFSASA